MICNLIHNNFSFKDLKPMEIVLLELLYIHQNREIDFSRLDFCCKYNITVRTLDQYITNLKRLGFICSENAGIFVCYTITEDGVSLLLQRDEYLQEVEKNKNKGF